MVENIDLPFLDINLAIDDAIEAGQIEVDREKDRIELLQKPEVTFDSDLAGKLLRTMQHYAKKELNITRGRLTSLVKNNGSQFNYPYHDYLMALQYLIDSKQIEVEEVTIPKQGKRPFQKWFVLQFPGNPNEDWNRNAVNKFIANWNKNK